MGCNYDISKLGNTGIEVKFWVGHSRNVSSMSLWMSCILGFSGESRRKPCSGTYALSSSTLQSIKIRNERVAATPTANCWGSVVVRVAASVQWWRLQSNSGDGCSVQWWLAVYVCNMGVGTGRPAPPIIKLGGHILPPQYWHPRSPKKKKKNAEK